MAKLERTYTIPLRQEFRKVPIYKRAKKAMTALQAFLLKHMKGKEVKIGPHLNSEIWKNGIKNPPHHVKVAAFKDDDNVVKAELFGKEYVEKKVEKKEEKPKGKLQEKLAELKKDMKSEKKEEKKEETKESAEKDVKAELKKLKDSTKKAMEEKAEEVAAKVEEKKPEEKPKEEKKE